MFARYLFHTYAIAIKNNILETKTSVKKPGPPEISTELKEWKYKRFANAEKAGYAGTAILSKYKPIAFTAGIGKSKHDKEGRVVTAEQSSVDTGLTLRGTDHNSTML